MKLLLAKGSNATVADKYGSSALQLAVGTNDDEAIIPLLIKAKADMNSANKLTGDTTLHYSVKLMRPRILLFLANKGAGVNRFNNKGLTPVHLAVQENNYEAFSILLERGAQTKARALSGVTALHTAVIEGNWLTFDLLVSAGADINAWDALGETPLHREASSCSSTYLAIKLLGHGANVEARKSRGYSVLQCAAMSINKEMFCLLPSHGVKIDVQTPKAETLLHITPPIDESALEILRIILESRPNIEALSSDGWTPLHQTAYMGTGSPDIALDKTRE